MMKMYKEPARNAAASWFAATLLLTFVGICVTLLMVNETMAGIAAGTGLVVSIGGMKLVYELVRWWNNGREEV